MRRLPTIIIVLLFAVNFCAGFIITGKLADSYSFINNSDPYFWVMAFTANGVQAIRLEELEDFKKLNPDYSFLVPIDKEDQYHKELPGKYKNLSFQFEVEQIAPDKQRIKLYSEGIISSGTYSYEAADKTVVPKPSAIILFGVNLLGGVLMCLIFLLIYRKYLAI